MTIQYRDGKMIEAALVARTENMLRVAPKGSDDALEFLNVNGTWVSEDCEPVRIEFEWQRRERKPEISEADCVCSQELAARLIHMLLSGEEEPTAAPLDKILAATANRLIV